jgi:hypothetical protein
MSRRVRLAGLLTVALLLAAVSLLLDWPDWLGKPSAEDLIGKWVPEDTKIATINIYRSGECELSWPSQGKDAPPEPETATGVWELKGRKLVLKVDSGSRRSFVPFGRSLQVSIWGNELTYQETKFDETVRIKFRRAPPEPDKSFDALNPPSFVGSSKGLQRTVVIPTLESLLPAGKSAIWCATLALAWQEAERQLGTEPIVLAGGGDLSRAPSSLPDVGLLPEHHYLAAGFTQDGIVERIRREMAARFPGAAAPDLAVDGPDRFVAYAYLQTSVRYEFAFSDSDKPLPFTNSQGGVTPIKAFGIRKKDEHMGKDSFRGQVRVLFREGNDFAVDLSKGTQLYQIVLARMERKATLQETLADLEKRVARALRKGPVLELGDGAVLLVPNMNWRIEHRFEEMQGKPMLHPALPPGSVLEMAYQLMQFKMERRGAELVSLGFQLNLLDGAELEDFRFDRPYLVLLRKRDLQAPFFVMWVDNAELLQLR